MAKSKAIIGKGTKFGYEDGSTPVWLGEVTNADDPPVDVADVEATHYESDDDFEEFMPGWKTGGDLPVELNYEMTMAATIEGLVGVSKTFVLQKPDGSEWDFPGYIKHRGGKNPNKDRITQELTIKVAGKPNFTPGA